MPGWAGNLNVTALGDVEGNAPVPPGFDDFSA
jgi:hypothetical protein